MNTHFLTMHIRDEVLSEAQAFEREFPGEVFPWGRVSQAIERGRLNALAADRAERGEAAA